MSFIEDIQALIFNCDNELVGIHSSWERVEVGQIADIINGFPFESAKFSNKKGIPLIRIRDILRSRSDTMFIGDIPEGYWVNTNDILIGMDGEFNCARWIGEDALLNQRVCKITINSELYNNSFFLSTIRGYLKLINDNTPSVTVKHLSSKTLANTPIPLPPLAEQIRIADKLDTLLARVDAGCERLERVPKLVKRFRQSVLSAAVSGELTREWRGGGEKEWATESIRIGDMGAVITGGTPKADVRGGSGEIPFFKPSELDAGYFVRTAKELVTVQAAVTVRTIPERTVMVTCIGATIGKTGLSRIAGITNQQINSVVCNENIILPEYLFCLVTSNSGQSEIIDNASSTTLPILNKSRFSDIIFEVPVVLEQAEIVRRVESLFAIADRLEARAQAALTRYARLTPALLAKAFRGELVPQDPDDEPASVLLERIRAQRAAEGEQPKRGRGGAAAATGEPKRRGRPPRAQAEGAQAGAAGETAEVQPPRRRGRPPKVRLEVESAAIPEASNFEDAVRQLEARKLERAQGVRQVELFGEEVGS